MDKIPIEYIVETLAKALCFEKYVAINNITDFETVDTEAAIKYYHERSEVYLQKSYELLSMFHDIEAIDTTSDTLH
jgi:hypothetical protein|tara:strand:+ start:260 stop:487 length:228 start_codon:yes stop_codon:yes gene_type:complete